MSTEADAPRPEPVTAIILAAGASSRMNGVDKLWADLDGAPVLAHSVRSFLGLAGLTELVLVGPRDRHGDFRALAGETAVRVLCVEGGERRQDSVAAGIAAAPEAAWYLVHDGARPLVTLSVIARALEAARAHGAAIPGVSVTDTIKAVDEQGVVAGTLERRTLRAVQTPQAFAGPLLRRAHAEATGEATDDAALVEALGEPVQVIEGDPDNLKVTTAHDLELARHLLKRRRGPGTG